jgi:hypothetical protein
MWYFLLGITVLLTIQFFKRKAAKEQIEIQKAKKHNENLC